MKRLGVSLLLLDGCPVQCSLTKNLCLVATTLRSFNFKPLSGESHWKSRESQLFPTRVESGHLGRSGVQRSNIRIPQFPGSRFKLYFINLTAPKMDAFSCSVWLAIVQESCQHRLSYSMEQGKSFHYMYFQTRLRAKLQLF